MIDENENKSQNSDLRTASMVPGNQVNSLRPTPPPSSVSSLLSTQPLPTSLANMGIKKEHLEMLTEIELHAIEQVAKEYLQNRDGIEGARRAAKAAAANARTVQLIFVKNEAAMFAESAVFVEAARGQAEIAGDLIGTQAAIRGAIKIARTSRQKFSLLLRLRNHELALKERQ